MKKIYLRAKKGTVQGAVVPKDRSPERLEGGPVVEDQVNVVAEEGAEADAEHGGHKEQEQNVKLALA